MAWRWQNTSHPHGRTPSYYANHRLYPGSYAPNESQTRTSRRVHDGFSITQNYGLDTTSDDVNSSPHSSPYYINGRYNSDNLVTQRGNSASVQGTKRVFIPDELKDVDDINVTDMQTTIEMWQGKQIRFKLPYSGKVIGNQLILKNTGGCTGILSIYFSTEPDGEPVYETAIDLCKISEDRFEKVELYSMTVVPQQANAKHELFVRMEIWDEVDQKRSANPYNTGRKIEIAATGLSNHEAYIYKLQDKNEAVRETYEYKPFPSRPLVGLIYSEWESVPVDRIDNMKTGASISYYGRRFDIYCVRNSQKAYLLIYDSFDKKLIKIPNALRPQSDDLIGIPVDPRAAQINIAQATPPDDGETKTPSFLYFVDGYSPLRRVVIGKWDSTYTFPNTSGDDIKAEVDKNTWYSSDLGKTSGTYVFTYSDADGGKWLYNGSEVNLATYGITLKPAGSVPADGSTINISYTVTLGGTKKIESIEFVDARPVVGASMIMFHNNRLYLSGFRNDPNLVQVSAIDENGPNFSIFPYRFYTPNRSPYDTSLTPVTAMVEYASDQIMFLGKSFFSIFRTYGSSGSGGLEDSTPTQVSTYVDSAGVQAQGDVCNYKGVIYSFDQKEGIRRFSGATWNKLPTTVDSHYDRVDMTKPRKIWGYANKLYFNYIDSLDGKSKCLIWDMDMNYQQYPWFQDVDIPFCDVRFDETEELYGIHPDYPCIMQLYAEDTWRRLDTPITFRRDTKFLSMPGNASDMIVKRVHAKIINNSNRWWFMSVNGDKQNMTQYRVKDNWYRLPVWDTITVVEPPETPFPFEDAFEENAIFRLSLTNLRIMCSAIQVRMKTKTFRTQANLVSILVEAQPKQYL